MKNALGKQELREYFLSHREEMMADLFALVRIPSVRDAGVTGMPFGKNCYRALACAMALFAREGFDTRMDEEGRYALAFFGEENIENSIGVFAHTDVVPAGDGWLYTTPFEPVLQNGCAIGRGVEDNKAGVILALWALKYIKEKGIAIQRPVTVFLGSAEESGMEDIEAFAENEGVPFASLVPDSEYPVCYGEKGIARAYMTAKEPFSDILEISGGNALNVVLDAVTLTLAFNEERERVLVRHLSLFDDISVEKENDKLVIKAKGISAHASMPEGSKNAAYLLFNALSSSSALCEGDRKILKQAAHILEKTDGSVASLDKEEKDFSPLTMANGIVKAEEGRLSFSLDIRYGTAVGEKELGEKLSASAEAYGFSLTMAENKQGFINDKNGCALSVILDACESFSGTRPEPFLMGGGTYCRHLPNAYSVGTAVSYVEDPFVAPKGHGGAHEADEHLPMEAFLENAALFTDILVRLAGIE